MAAKAKSRRIRERRKHLGAWGILLIVLFVFGASTVAGIRLKQKNLTYQQREEALQESIDKEEARSQEIDDLEAYTKTKKYVEDVAKDKLGLVYEDEIIFKAKNKLVRKKSSLCRNLKQIRNLQGLSSCRKLYWLSHFQMTKIFRVHFL